jgi:hypothetical protein
MFKLVTIIVFVSLLTGCHSSRMASSYRQLDFDAFTILVPSSWEKVRLRGIDSYVGGIKTGTKDTFHFDLGMYSNTLSGRNSHVTWEEIDGYPVKMVRPKKGTAGITGIYIDSLSGEGLNRNRFNLYGKNISTGNQKAFWKAVRTLQFIK